MASAFDDLPEREADDIRHMFLAGATMKAIRDSHGVSHALLREMRDEIFEPLIADPDKVKELAAGPVFNPNEIVKYKRPLDRAARMARPRPVQIEMFPA